MCGTNTTINFNIKTFHPKYQQYRENGAFIRALLKHKLPRTLFFIHGELAPLEEREEEKNVYTKKHCLRARLPEGIRVSDFFFIIVSRLASYILYHSTISKNAVRNAIIK